MKGSLFVYVLAILLAGLPSTASAQIITQCGSSRGYTYIFEGGLVPRGSGGMQEDGISQGGLQLVRDGNNLDVFIKDAVGMRSIKADGFEVINMSARGASAITVIAANGRTGVVEHYLFRLDRSGNGTVAWGTIRGDGSIAKSSLFVANCRQP